MCSEPGFGASVSSSLTTTGAGSPSRPRLWAARRWHGIAPAPERGRSMSWSTFLKTHWGAIAATDLFTVEVVNPFGLVRYHVLLVIDIATRCVCIGGMTPDPDGEWMKQVARNLTDMWDGFLLGKRYLIHDRDPLFTEAVRGLLRDSGVKPLRLPANSPNLNAYAERFVLSIRRECLDRFVPLNDNRIRSALSHRTEPPRSRQRVPHTSAGKRE